MVSIKDIAQLAGVSVATVSNVLNGKPGSASAAKVAEILNAAEKLHYQPNAFARNLRRQQSNSLGIITEDLTVFNAPEIVNRIEEYCEEQGYEIILANLRLFKRYGNDFTDTPEHTVLFERALDNLLAKQVAGIVYVGYHNLPGSSHYSDLRAAHGVKDPHGVRYWCLGNEMDGPWQIGHKTADEYGRLAVETARAMRRIDPHIKLVAAGSSFPEMPTFPQWETTVLEHAYDDVDFLSLHQYLGDTTDNLQDYLAKSLTTERFIRSVISTCDYVQAKKRSSKRMQLSFDEWNVWWRTSGEEDRIPPWQHAPSLLEEIYAIPS